MGRCSCADEDHDKEEHPCPFQSEIRNNDEPYCTCCAACERECARDI